MNNTNQSTQIEEFIHPKAMLTPAAAGAVVTLISGALYKNFSISVAICSIVLSFMIGLVVLQSREFKAESMSRISKIVLYTLNSLIIFASATGTTSVMAQGPIIQERPFFQDWTKDNEGPVLPNITESSPYDFIVTVEPENVGAFKNILQDANVVDKNYRVIIKVQPKDGADLEDIETVKITLPKSNFKPSEIPFSDKQIKKGIEIKAWKSFPIKTQITTKDGNSFSTMQNITIKSTN